MTGNDIDFVPTEVGMNYGYPNLIHEASRVQVYGDGYGNFFVAVPGSSRTTSIRGVAGPFGTVDEAIDHARTLIPAGVARMTHLHAEAIRLDRARGTDA